MLALAHDCAQGLDNVVHIGELPGMGGDTRRAWQAREAWCDGDSSCASVCALSRMLSVRQTALILSPAQSPAP